MEESFGVIPLKKTQAGHQVFIVCLRSGHHWGFPKGHKQKGETAKEAALRELKEETSMEVESFLSEESLVEEYLYEKEGKKIAKKVCYFPAFVKKEPLIQKEEILEGKWVSLKEAEDLVTYVGSRKVLERVEKILEKI